MTPSTVNAPESPTPAASPASPAEVTASSKHPSSSPSPGRSRLPKPAPPARKRLLLWGSAAVLLLVAATATYLLARRPYQQSRTDLVLHHVKYDRLELTVVERGTLESAKNSDIFCTVKAGQNAGGKINVKWLIDDGSEVKKGDLLIELDDSAFQDQLKDKKIVVDQAEGARTQAEEEYKITISQNESEIKTAEVKMEIAEIDLQKYREGDYPQKLKDIEGKIKSAESDVDQQRERAAWAKRMVKKGFLTAVQAQAEQSKLDSLELVLANCAEARRVLTDPTFGERKREETNKMNDVAETRRALDRVKSQAKAKEVKARTDRDTKRLVHEQELAKYRDIQSEIKKCKIIAPQDGMVVYFVPEQARFGSGSQQSIVAQGEPVREGQKLMQIPDLRSMMVNTKVHEAMVSQVHSGLPARVRVDSFPDRRLRGEIDWVSTVSSQQDWLSSDVKVYTTKVMIDDSLPGLKPGMSAEVTITIGDALEHVLTVPVQAIVGSAEMGKKRKCVVMTPEGPQARDIVVGVSNDKMAEVKEGLSDGDEVVLNPRAVLGEQIKTGRPGRGKEGGDEKGGEKGKKGGEKGKGGKRQSPGEDGGPDRQKAMLEKARPGNPQKRKQASEAASGKARELPM